MTTLNDSFLDDVVTQATVDPSELSAYTLYDIEGDLMAGLAGADEGDALGVLLSAEAARMVALAVSQIGVRESGGDNQGVPLTRYVRWFNPTSGPQPWCAFFVSYCWDRATDSNRRVPWGNPGYCGAIHSWAQRTGRLVSRPQRGDIYIYTGMNHCGIVESVGTSSFTSIDGNWGDAVRRVPGRSLRGFYFVRL